MGKGFASPAQYRGQDYKNALVRNWRALTTHINRFMPSYEPDGTTIILPGDLTVLGDLDVQGDDGSSEGVMYVSTSSATTIATSGTFVKVAGTYSAGELTNFTHATGKLTYIGAQAHLFHVDVAVSTTTGTANQTIAWRIAKNGTTIAGSEIQRKQGTAADIGALALDWALTLNPNDYIEIFVTNNTSTGSVTADRLVCTVS